MSGYCVDWNPVRSTFTAYRPGSRLRTANVPSSLDSVDTARLVVLFVIVTVAPEITAPEGSEIVPVRPPDFSCPNARPARRHRKIHSPLTLKTVECLIASP